ncbi:MAG: hypothetical protein EBR51_00140 [Gammaproteobacteria bacterium]|jgi:hypothetical protein|nr:hypothetical protein [Gammaproteobacteria bacterium]
MNEAFDIAGERLVSVLSAQKNAFEKKNLANKNLLCINKFCEVAQLLNIDPMEKWALHIVIIIMCKNSNPMAIARKFSEEVQCGECVRGVDESKEIYNRCNSLFSTMSDWITLFQYLELNIEDDPQHGIEQHVEGRKLINEVRKNFCLKHMMQSLATAQVFAENMTPLETAILAFKYISPRTTPAGHMLERLYCGINNNARDTELRCLRVLSLFNDSSDIESYFPETMCLVMRCFRVKETFHRLVENVLRQQKEVVQVETLKTIRPLLRSLAAAAVQKRIRQVAMDSWSNWRNAVNFPITTSMYVQKLLYFICIQPVQPAREEFQHLFHEDILKRAGKTRVDLIDVDCVIDVLRNLRRYNGEISSLIDFRHKCLFGVNEKIRQEISLTQVTQLYICVNQHPSIIETCWKMILPVFNHTIRNNINEFKKKNKYEVSQVVRNLVHNILN